MAEQSVNVISSSGSTTPQKRLSKFSTGDAGFDRILSGGIPRDSVYIVSGSPGAGKTILAQQVAFAAAKAGLNVLYLTNVSEPHSKLIQHIRNFGFYEDGLIGSSIRIYNITSQVRDKGFQQTLDFVVETVRSEKADLVVVDSFRGLKHALEVKAQERGAIFDMTARLSMMSCTSLLLGEYTALELETDSEFAIADGIINLWHATSGPQDRRTLHVSKMRGMSYLGGEHSFAITEQGLTVYPRQESMPHEPGYSATSDRISTGIPSIDTMMNGGLIRCSSTLIAGSPGTGKTLLGLHFLAAGAALGERGLMVSFQENPAQLALRVASFGLNESLGFDSGLTHVLYMSPIELNIDEAAAYIRRIVEDHRIRRVVIDSVGELEHAVEHPERFDDFLTSLVGYLRRLEVTTLLLREITQFFGMELSISSRGLSYIVDNIVLLRYIEWDGYIRRAVAVLKIRGSDHDKSLRELLIGDGSIRTGERYERVAGLMTGMPRFDPNVPDGLNPRVDQ